MVIWVCEASEVNNLTALAVGPNSRDVTEVIPLLLRRLHPRNAYSGSVPFGSDKNALKTAFWGDTNLDQVTLEGAGTPNFKSTDIFDMFPENLGAKAFR